MWYLIVNYSKKRSGAKIIEIKWPRKYKHHGCNVGLGRGACHHAHWTLDISTKIIIWTL